MTTAEGLAWVDPTDLDGLRGALSAADPEGRLAPIAMSRIEIGTEALYVLPEIVSELAREAHAGDLAAAHVALVVDATPMHRDGGDLKEEAERLLGGRFEVRRAVIGGEGIELHADEEALAEAEAAVAGADCAVVVGSGTITDVCKEATRRTGGSPLVVVQTAASVNAFSDDMAVLLKSGTKRTVPSRWPDALLVDLTTLAGAPPEMNLAGFGDLLAMWTAPADWYLARAVGMDDSYHPAPIGMLHEQGQALEPPVCAGVSRRC
jgi:glycerol-1-phosphate dehydrogenase [NAD(P)+]